MTASTLCVRCGAAFTLAGCPACGCTNDDEANLQQERYLGYVLDDVLNSADPLLALQDWHAASAARRRSLQTQREPLAMADPVAVEPAGITEPTAASLVAEQALAPPTSARPPPAPPPTSSSHQTSAPPTPARPPRPTAARPAPTLSPTPPALSAAEARAVFERRLEVGGWFVGALFAVGGSLWATNLFWGDIPAMVRPMVVAAGLVLFASAFLAMGGLLATRHRDSVAGDVFSVVGRLIGVAATVPLASLRDQPLVVELGVDLVVLTALAITWRLADAHRKPAWSSTGWTLAIAALTVVAQAHEAQGPGFAAVVATLLVMRAALAAGTMAALNRASTWVDDLVVLSAGGLAAVRGVGGSDASTSAWALVVVAGLELLVRCASQRPHAFSWTATARRIFLVGALIGLAVVATGPQEPLFHVAAWGFVSVALFRPRRLGLPRVAQCASVLAGAMAAASSSLLVAPLVTASLADTLWATTFIAWVFVCTRELRRSANGPEAVASVLLWCTCSVVALSQHRGTRGAAALVEVVPLVLAATLWAVDHRARTSAAFNLGTVIAGVLPVAALVHAWCGPATSPIVAASLVAFAIAVHLWHRRGAAQALPLSSAATAWVTVAASIATVALAVAADASAWQVAIVLTVGVAVLAELSRQLVLATAALVLCGALGLLGLQRLVDVPLWWCGNAILAVFVALSFLPRLPVRAVRALVASWAPGARARHARAWSAVIVTSVALVVLVGLRVLSPGEAVPIWASLLPTTLVAVALAVRHPTTRQSALALAVWIATGGEGGAAVARVVEARLPGLVPTGALLPLCAGLGMLLAAWLVAALVVVARAVPLPLVRTSTTAQAPWQTPVFLRLFRRRESVAVVATWWQVAAAGALVGGIVATTGALTLGSIEHLLLALTAVLLVGGVVTLTLSMTSSEPLLTAGGTCLVLLAPFSLAQRALLVGDERGTLLCALVGLALVAATVLGARALYQRRPVPVVLAMWPPSWALRRPALAVLAAVGSLVGAAGLVLHAQALVDTAHRYGPGLVVVGVAVIAVSLLAARTRRTTRVAIGAAAIGAAAALGIDAVAHAAVWLPRSHGASQAALAVALVALLALLERRGGRAVLWRLRLGWPRPVRHELRRVLVGAVVVVGVGGLWLSVMGLPHVTGIAWLGVGAAWCALAIAAPATNTTIVGVGGGGLIAAGVAAVVVEWQGFAALAVHTTPVLVCAALIALAVVQRLARRVWASETLRALHPGVDVEALGETATDAAERFVLLATIPLVLLAIVDDMPSSASLLSTWLGFAVVITVTSAMAFSRELTWPAALAQGMALSLYVDLRRRTTWLDHVDGIDAIACLVGAAALLVVSVLARRRRGGASTARAAEFYALTLPVIAAGFGDSHAARAVICLVGGGLYAVLARHRRRPLHELACGLAFVAAAMLALAAQGSDDVVLYLLPGSVVATYLGRRHRRLLGTTGRFLSLWCHVPVYVAAAWSALQHEDFGSFVLAIVVVTVGVFYAIRVRDRRALIAASVAAAVLVLGRLLLLGLDNAALGTVLLAGLGIGVLAAMTIFTLRRDAATAAVQQATRGMQRWDDDERTPVDLPAAPTAESAESAATNDQAPGVEPGA